MSYNTKIECKYYFFSAKMLILYFAFYYHPKIIRFLDNPFSCFWTFASVRPLLLYSCQALVPNSYLDQKRLPLSQETFFCSSQHSAHPQSIFCLQKCCLWHRVVQSSASCHSCHLSPSSSTGSSSSSSSCTCSSASGPSCGLQELLSKVISY